jgi:hypothetical protein
MVSLCSVSFISYSVLCIDMQGNSTTASTQISTGFVVCPQLFFQPFQNLRLRAKILQREVLLIYIGPTQKLQVNAHLSWTLT